MKFDCDMVFVIVCYFFNEDFMAATTKQNKSKNSKQCTNTNKENIENVCICTKLVLSLRFCFGNKKFSRKLHFRINFAFKHKGCSTRVFSVQYEYVGECFVLKVRKKKTKQITLSCWCVYQCEIVIEKVFGFVFGNKATRK